MPRVYPTRTVLARRIRERRLTFEEFVKRLEVFARDNHEVGTVSLRHVQRLTAGLCTAAQLRPATVRLLEKFFESSIDELLAAPDVPEDEESLFGLAGELPVPKRDLLAGADRARHLLDRTIAERSVTPAQVDKIDHMVRLHAQACVTMPPTVMLRRLIADFDEFRWLVSQAQSPTTLVRLYGCIAQIAALIADEMMVLGDTHRAWAWHHSAIVATDETGLSELGLQVRSLGILIPLYSGDPREALSMASEACHVGRSVVNKTLPAYALAVTLKALILAQLGSVDECKAALDESSESFARLGRTDEADSVFGFSERRWRFYRARTFTELGDFSEAWEAQDRALDLYPTDVVGDPTLIRLDRALCLVRQNEIDAGCQLATDTFASLPPEHHTSIFFGYGKKVLAAVPREYANRHTVSLYRAAMAESRQAIAAM